jgi:hypothetical protein
MTEIKDFAGHKSIETTAGYCHVRRAHLKQEVDRTSIFAKAPPMVVEERIPPRTKEPIDRRTVAVDMFLRGEMTEETFRMVMANIELEILQ